MNTSIPFEISLALNGTSHDDLVVRLGSFERVSDTYWLALDPQYKPEEENDAKAREVLGLLLGCWLAGVEALHEGESILLPFDFQDEWIGCFQATRKGETLELEPGELDENGYSVIASAPEDMFKRRAAFVGSGELVRVDLSGFRSYIESSRQALSGA